MTPIEALDSEIDNEAVVDARGGQVVHGLGFVSLVDGFTGFEFDEQLEVADGDDHVCLEFPDELGLVEDIEGNVGLEVNACACQFDLQRTVINRFQKSGAKLTMNLHGDADHLVGEFVHRHWSGGGHGGELFDRINKIFRIMQD